jgi:hippurate hydrolase
MVAAGHVLVALQSIVARNVDPLDTAVVTIGTIEGGKAANQIPSKVTMRGTQRFYRDEVRDLLTESINRVAHGIATTFGMKAQVDVSVGIGPTVNHKPNAGLAVEACNEFKQRSNAGINVYFSTCWRQHTCNHFEQSAFTRTILPKDTDAIARINTQ